MVISADTKMMKNVLMVRLVGTEYGGISQTTRRKMEVSYRRLRPAERATHLRFYRCGAGLGPGDHGTWFLSAVALRKIKNLSIPSNVVEVTRRPDPQQQLQYLPADGWLSAQLG